MHRGQIIESGTHEELLQKNGLYAALSKLGEIDKAIPQEENAGRKVRSGTMWEKFFLLKPSTLYKYTSNIINQYYKSYF